MILKLLHVWPDVASMNIFSTTDGQGVYELIGRRFPSQMLLAFKYEVKLDVIMEK